MSQRYISLYFASIDVRRAALLILAWLTAPFASRASRRRRLSEAVREQLGDLQVFAYGTGRGALAACLRAAGIGEHAGERDVVLLSSFTCLAVPAAVLAVGAQPEYIDIDPLTLDVPAEAALAALHPRVRAVVVQHTLGRSAAFEPLLAAAAQRGLLLIEDCALSVGSRTAGRPLGGRGNAAIYSMELSKTISTGWGGVLAVRDAQLARRVEEQYAQVPEPRRLTTARRVWQTAISGVCLRPWLFPVGRYAVAAAFRIGLFRLSTPQAEIEGRPDARFIERLSGTHALLGAAQWRRLPQVAARCAVFAARLREALRGAKFTVLAQPDAQDIAVTPRVAFLVADRPAAMRWFAARNVELGSWFDGPLSPPPASAAYNYERARYPQAALVASRVVNLASHCRLVDADVERLSTLIAQYAVEQI